LCAREAWFHVTFALFFRNNSTPGKRGHMSRCSFVHDSVRIAWCKTKKKTCSSVVTSSELPVIMGRGNDFVEKRGSSSQNLSGSRRRYDANFKVMVINHAEVTNNCAVGRKFDVTEANVRRWRQMMRKLRNANSSRKSFSGPETGRFQDLEQRAIPYVREKRNEGFPVMREVIRTKALELSREMPTPANTGKFKASKYRLVRSYDQTGRTSFSASNNSRAETSRLIMSKAAGVAAACCKIKKAALVYAGPYRKYRSDAGIF
jgi:hypothetical protein